MTFDWKTHPTQENAKPPLNSHHPTYTQSQRMHVHTSLPKGSAVSDLVFCFPKACVGTESSHINLYFDP